jgi:AraC-like DNA-binding protein
MPAHDSAPFLSGDDAGTRYGAFQVIQGTSEPGPVSNDRVGLAIDLPDVAGEGGEARLQLGALDRLTADGGARRVILATRRRTAPGWLARTTNLTAIAPSAFTALIVNLVEGLVGATPRLNPEDAPAVIEAILLLAGQALERPADPNAPAWTLGDAEMFAAARLIDERLLDRGLDAESLMRALGLSRSSLYRAFQSVGGVKAYIRQRRLERARDVLANRTGPRPTVGEVAQSCGFASDSHFSRAFRKAFGYPPGAQRESDVSGGA